MCRHLGAAIERRLGVLDVGQTHQEQVERRFRRRLIRTIKEEEGNLSEYRNLYEPWSPLGHFIESVYQIKRVRSALGYLTPVEFETAWKMAPE